mgnify:FL=1
MIGFYDYTVILTYLSLLSGASGIIVCLNGIGHPYLGMFFLLFSGLCDTFDGKVARSKKNRTSQEKLFGIQIDSLSDLVAFGVLPACIGIAMLRCSLQYTTQPSIYLTRLQAKPVFFQVILTVIAAFYVLAAMIRLAYFNVLEEEDQNRDENGEKIYLGLPVTSSALIFPAVLLLHVFISADLTLLYFGVLIVMGFLFLSKIHIKKPQNKQIALMIFFGALEFIILTFILVFLKTGGPR